MINIFYRVFAKKTNFEAALPHAPSQRVLVHEVLPWTWTTYAQRAPVVTAGKIASLKKSGN